MRKSSDKVVPLMRQQPCERGAAVGLVMRHDHLADGADALGVEEHVLGAAEADAFGAELAGGFGVQRGFGVGAHLHAAGLVGPDHEGAEITRERRFDHRHTADEDLTGGTVDGDDIAGMDGVAAGADGLGVVIDGQAPCPGDARPAHAARDDRGVAGHAAAGGDDAAGRVHAVDVLGAGFDAHQDHGLAIGRA